MKLAWLTDIHLNFIRQIEVKEVLCYEIHRSRADAVLITGDIAASANLCQHLEFLAKQIQKPIYFVLGNHDYYGSSIERVNSEVAKVVEQNNHLVWLSQSGVIELSPDTCLIGHEGFADGRLGDPLGSQVVLNDYHLIKELHQPTKELRLKIQNELGDAAARHIETRLNEAINRYNNIIVALHVPPFYEACWHLGKLTDDNFLPHFACKATGDVLKTAMQAHPNVSMVVYCGHTHSGGYTEILSNLRVFTGAAEYSNPCITDCIHV